MKHVRRRARFQQHGDYHLFPGLKKQLQSRHFSSDAEVIAAAWTWLDGQLSGFFFEWLAKVRATG
jgi:hypothetical protein